MPHFTEIPEALDHIVGQGWLSPNEPVLIRTGPQTTIRQGNLQPIGWRAALREIAAILRRLG